MDTGSGTNVDQVDIVAVAGHVDAGQVLDARAALAGAIAVGVLQDGPQGECIGAAHYRTGRAPGAAAGGAASWCAVRPGPGQDRAGAAPCPGAGTAMGGSWGHADVDQVNVVAAADGVGASQLLDARTALAGALTSGVLQAGRQLVRRVLRSWPGPCMRPALAPSRRRHGNVDPEKRYRRRSAVLRPWPATLMLARCSMRARRWPARLPSACCRMASRASVPADAGTTRARFPWRILSYDV